MLEFDNLTKGQIEALKLICTNSLMGFQRVFFNLVSSQKWQVNWHHTYIAKIIEEVIEGKRGSVIFNVPPGAGKTEILSIHAPVYSMLKTKLVRNLNISFSNSLVQRNSNRSKDIIKSHEFQTMFPMNIGKDKADEWQVTNEKGRVVSEVISRSINGQITGARGGHMVSGFSGWIALDDIDKPGDMYSEIKRKATHELLINTIKSRRAKKGEDATPIIVIQQRLHVDDSTAFLLDSDRGIGVDFDHIVVPALINKEYIDSLPEWIREECWNSVKDSECINGYYSYWPESESVRKLHDDWEKNPYTFLSQLMQTPIALSGSIYNVDWFRYYTPGEVNFEYRFTTADTAQKTKSHNDYSVICEWGVSEGNLYLIDLIRGKWEAPELRERFIAFINDKFSKNDYKNGNLRSILVEDKSSGTGLIQELKNKLPLPITALQRNTDKVSRAYDASPQIQLGKVHLPEDAWFLSDVITEHGLFTANDSHRHDDIVDNTCDAIDHALLKQGGDILNMMFKKRG